MPWPEAPRGKSPAIEMRNPSPFRYPGGKSSLLPLLRRVLFVNGLQRRPYVEPFAGGGGLALSLLFSRAVTEIHLNDVDPAIWSFWHTATTDAETLIDFIRNVELSVSEWEKQREFYLAADSSNPAQLAKAALYLNRTNRSGIMKTGGIIGGRSQSGPYKIDCRFNRDEICRRLARIQKYAGQIRVTGMDAVPFIQETAEALGRQVLFCIDPPYCEKGQRLYTNFYRPSDHEALRGAVSSLACPWIVTYDNVPLVQELYCSYQQFTFNIQYSAANKGLGSELLIAPQTVFVPQDETVKRFRIERRLAA